jgi:hypothetical protein
MDEKERGHPVGTRYRSTMRIQKKSSSPANKESECKKSMFFSSRMPKLAGLLVITKQMNPLHEQRRPKIQGFGKFAIQRVCEFSSDAEDEALFAHEVRNP